MAVPVWDAPANAAAAGPPGEEVIAVNPTFAPTWTRRRQTATDAGGSIDDSAVDAQRSRPFREHGAASPGDATGAVLASPDIFWSVAVVVVVACLTAILALAAADGAGPSATTTVLKDSLPEGAAAARARYNEGDFAGALAAADAVDVEFRAGAAFATLEAAWSVWADARMTRALALRRLGRDGDADATLLDLAAVRPSYAPDKGFVPPRVVARFEELRDGLIAGPTSALTVVVDGAGDVVLDGRVRGPGTIDVLPGTHFLAVAPRDGTAPHGELVVVDGSPRIVRLATGAAPVVDVAAVASGSGNAAEPAVNDGPPWLWVGLGFGAVAIAASAIAVGAVVQGRGEPVTNPGGITVAVDSSRLDAP
jgi:hypothetical protein